MATEAELQAGAKAIALNCASANCLRFIADVECPMKEECCCRQDARLAIEAAERVRAGGAGLDGSVHKSKGVISDALFDCYRGYNAETIGMFKMQSQPQRDAQAERAIAALADAGFKIVRK